MQPNPLDLWVELMSISLGSPAGYNRKKVPKCMLSLGQTHTPDQSFLLFGWWIEYKYLNNVQPNWIASAGAGFKIAGFTLKKAVIRNHSIFSSSFMEPSIMDSSNYKPKNFWQKKNSRQHCSLWFLYRISNCCLQKINTFITRTVKSSCKYRFHTAQSGIHHKISSGNTTLIEHFKHTQTTVQTIKEHQRKSKEEKEKPHRIKQ